MNSSNYTKIVKIMVKRFKQFVNENVNNPDSYLDSKMQEIKDMIAGIDSSTSLIYDWENKNDHELYVNFSKDELTIRYEFDIDDLKLTKIAGGVTDFQTAVDSIDAGINMIERDINSILGVNESVFNIFKNKNNDKEENISIMLVILKDYLGRDKVFIEFNSLSPYSKVTNKLIKKMSSDLSIKLYEVTVNSFDGKRLNDVIDYLKNLGLEYTEFGSRADSKDTDKNNNKSGFKGKLSLNDLK